MTFLRKKEIEEYVKIGNTDGQESYLEPDRTYDAQELYVEPDQTYAETESYVEPNQPYAAQESYVEPDQPYAAQESYVEPDQTYTTQRSYLEPDQPYKEPESHAEPEATEAAAGEHIPTLAEETRTLALKIMFVLVAFFVIFTFIFGLHRNLSVDMQPSLRDGDLLFYYRLDKDYRANNIVVFDYKDDMIASRVIAVPGDTVNITDKGLEINGHVMIEPEIYSQTTQFKGGPTFPLTVEEGTVFVLGDNREHANDSRIIGLIDGKDIKGKVMGVVRRRNL